MQHLKTMDKMWGRPGAGAPLSKEQKDFARKQKCKISCHWSFELPKISLKLRRKGAVIAIQRPWVQSQWQIQGRCPPSSPLIFRANWGPLGPKKFFSRPPPLTSGFGWLPPLPASKGLDLPLNPQPNHWLDLFSIVPSSTPWSPLSITNRLSSGKMFVSILICGPQ